MNPREKKIVWLLALVGSGAVLGVMFACDPARVPIYPVCPFHRITGLDCPGCGSLRAMYQLLHGHVATALRFNALLVLSLPLFAWFGFRYVAHFTGARPAPPPIRPSWGWLYLSAWVAFGVMRNLPVPFFATLAP